MCAYKIADRNCKKPCCFGQQFCRQHYSKVRQILHDASYQVVNSTEEKTWYWLAPNGVKYYGSLIAWQSVNGSATQETK